MPEERKEEVKRGGTEEDPIVAKPIKDKGQCMIIHAVSEGNTGTIISPDVPSLAREFFEQLN